MIQNTNDFDDKKINTEDDSSHDDNEKSADVSGGDDNVAVTENRVEAPGEEGGLEVELNTENPESNVGNVDNEMASNQGEGDNPEGNDSSDEEKPKQNKKPIVLSEERLLWEKLISDPNYRGSERFKKALKGFLIWLPSLCAKTTKEEVSLLFQRFKDFYDKNYSGEHLEAEVIELYEDIKWLSLSCTSGAYRFVKEKISDYRYEQYLEWIRIYYDQVEALFHLREQARYLTKERYWAGPLVVPKFLIEIQDGEYDIKDIRPIIDFIVWIYDSAIYWAVNGSAIASSGVYRSWIFFRHGTIYLLDPKEIEEVFKQFYRTTRTIHKRERIITYSPFNKPSADWKPKFWSERKLFRHQKKYSSLISHVSIENEDHPIAHYHAVDEEKHEKLVLRRKYINKKLKDFAERNEWLNKTFILPVAHAIQNFKLNVNIAFDKAIKVVNKQFLIAKEKTTKSYSALKIKAQKLKVQSSEQYKKFKITFHKQKEILKTKYDETYKAVKAYFAYKEKYDEDGNLIPPLKERFITWIQETQTYIAEDLRGDIEDGIVEFYKKYLKSHVDLIHSKFSYVAKYVDFKITRQLDKYRDAAWVRFVWGCITIWQQTEIERQFAQDYDDEVDRIVDVFLSKANKTRDGIISVLNFLDKYGKFIFYFPEQLLFGNIKFNRYRYIYTYQRNCSIDDEMAWDKHPDIPPKLYNLLNKYLFHLKYIRFNPFESYTYFFWNEYWIEFRRWLLNDYPTCKPEFRQLRQFLIRDFSYNTTEIFAEEVYVDRDYDRWLLSDVFDPLSSDIYIYRSIDEIPEIVYNYKSYSLFATTLRDLQNLIFGSYLYEMQFQMDHKLHEPFLQVQKDAHRLINKIRCWWMNYCLARNKRELFKGLFLYDELLKQYDDQWVHYTRRKPPVSHGLKLGFKYLNIYRYLTEDVGGIKVREIQLTQWWDLLKRQIHNIPIQWSIKKVSFDVVVSLFFKDFDPILSVNKKLIKFQRRNLKWYRWFVRWKKKQARKRVARHLALLQQPSNFFPTVLMRELISTCQPKNYLLSLFQRKDDIPEGRVFATTGIENFTRNYTEVAYWINTCLWTTDCEMILKAKENKYISNEQLENPIIRFISHEINAIHTLFNQQDFPIFPLTGEAPILLIQGEIVKISNLLNKFHIRNPKRKIISQKDIFIRNVGTKVPYYGLFEFLHHAETITTNLRENIHFYKKLSGIFQARRNYYDIHPFLPIYKREYIRYNALGPLKTLLNNIYVHNVDLMDVDGLAPNFEYDSIWNTQKCEQTKNLIDKKIKDRVHYSNI